MDGVGFQLMPGETLGLVGESGSGKTMTCLSILKLLARGAEIVRGQILFDGEDITESSEREMEELRGKSIGMILQNSMAALDPVFTIGTQIGEPLVVHQRLGRRAALEKSVELLRRVKTTDRHFRIRNQGTSEQRGTGYI